MISPPLVIVYKPRARGRSFGKVCPPRGHRQHLQPDSSAGHSARTDALGLSSSANFYDSRTNPSPNLVRFLAVDFCVRRVCWSAFFLLRMAAPLRELLKRPLSNLNGLPAMAQIVEQRTVHRISTLS
uniref:(northern house mosquito) hypothetical protein n=1 Tax=Culex pipiens TaxID=7175 RepID=A0A8D8MNC8_CULPI